MKSHETSLIGQDDADMLHENEDHGVTDKKWNLKRLGRRLVQSQCFQIVLRLYHNMHADVDKYDMLKLQLLSKKCYEDHIPRVLSQLNITFEMAPCRSTMLE